MSQCSEDLDLLEAEEEVAPVDNLASFQSMSALPCLGKIV